MKKELDFYKDKPSRIFGTYFLNSVVGAMSVAIYVLFDTIFIGWGVGSDGLAALNIAIPVFNVMISLGMLLGVGGANSMSLFMGRGEDSEAREFFPITIGLGVVLSVVVTFLGMYYLEDIIYLLGADESIFSYTMDYIKPAVMFSWIYLFNFLLQTYIRNDGNPRLPMLAGVVSGVLNIFLDMLFIFKFKMGMRGAIVATLISTVVGMAMLLAHFRKKECSLSLRLPRDRKISALEILRKTGRVFKNGFPSFIIEISSGVIIMLFNNRLMTLLGVDGVSAYSIIANVNYIMMAVFNGSALAIQPAVSKNYGAREDKRVLEFLKLGEICCLAFGIIFTLSGYLFSDKLVYLFLDNPSASVCLISKISIEIYFLTYLFNGSNILCGMFLQAIEREGQSTVASVLRGIVLPSLLMFLLPVMFGKNAIWATVVVSEGACFALTFWFVCRAVRSLRA